MGAILMTARGNFYYEVKPKRVYCTVEQDCYLIEFKDDATAFSGLKKGTVNRLLRRN